MITLPWHELVSWCIALVSATLFFVERRRSREQDRALFDLPPRPKDA